MQQDDSKNEQEMKSKAQTAEEAAVSASAQNGSETKEADIGAASKDIVMLDAEEDKVRVVQLMTHVALSILFACGRHQLLVPIETVWHLVWTFILL